MTQNNELETVGDVLNWALDYLEKEGIMVEAPDPPKNKDCNKNALWAGFVQGITIPIHGQVESTGTAAPTAQYPLIKS